MERSPRRPRSPVLPLGLCLLIGQVGCQGRTVPPPPEAAAGEAPREGRGFQQPPPAPPAPPPGPAVPEPEGATPIPRGAAAATAGAAPAPAGTPATAGARIFDHRHTDLGRIPARCAEALTSSPDVVHFGHRSHGSQILVGAKAIAQARPAFKLAAGYVSVPREAGALKVWDGMTKDNGTRPEHYWASEAGVADLRGLLRAHPEIRFSAWAWSSEIAQQSEADIQRYLDTIGALEREFPKVTFIYMTGPADDAYNAKNRAARNQQIRAHCQAHGKVLFDFEDLEVWYGAERHTAPADGAEVPMQHPRYSVKTPGNTESNWTHTTQESCEVKARAFWWMMAKLRGCELP